MEEKKTRKKKSADETAASPSPEPRAEEKKKSGRKKAAAAGEQATVKADSSAKDSKAEDKPKRRATKKEAPEATAEEPKPARARKSAKTSAAAEKADASSVTETEKKKSSTARKKAEKAAPAETPSADKKLAEPQKATKSNRSAKTAAKDAKPSIAETISKAFVAQNSSAAMPERDTIAAASDSKPKDSQSGNAHAKGKSSVEKKLEVPVTTKQIDASNSKTATAGYDRPRYDNASRRDDPNAKQIREEYDGDAQDSDRGDRQGEYSDDDRRRNSRRRGRRGGKNRRRNRFDDYRQDDQQPKDADRNSYPDEVEDADLDEVQKQVEKLIAEKSQAQTSDNRRQAQPMDRNDRTDRPDRSERTDRSDRQERGDRPDRRDRQDRGGRQDRGDRRDRYGDRGRNENYFNDNYGRTRDAKLSDEQIARERELEEYANQFDVELEQDDVPIVSLDSLRTLETPDHKKHSRAKAAQQSQRDDRANEKANSRRIERFAPANIAPAKLITDIQRKDEFIREFLTSTNEKLVNDLFVTSDAHLLVGVSGGVDSIALLDAMAQISQKVGFTITVAHFNHMLRAGDSDEDEKFVMQVAKEYNLQVYTGSGDVKDYAEKNSISIEQSARSLRYAFFHRIAKHVKANYIATAHTADDSAETFFINLLRGSGLTGLRGIPAIRPMNKGVVIIRPFIDKKKKTLVEYAHRRNLEWREDESNNLLQFTRNKVRNELIPYLEDKYSPAIVELINRTSRLIDGADRFISDYVDKVAQSVITDRRKDRFSVKTALFQTFDDFIQGEIIQLLISTFFKAHTLPMAIIDRIIKLFEANTGAVCEINKLLYAVKDRETVIFARRRQASDELVQISKEGEFDFFGNKFILKEVEKQDVRLGEDPFVEYLDYDLVPAIMYVRPWQEGDSFRPLGMAHGSQKVSDLLTNEKLSVIEKNDILLLTSKTEVIWVCGMRISESFKLRSGSTTRYLRVEYRPSVDQE